jgi:uncharacterized membrane protein
MDFYLILLLIVHIFAGIFWVGATIFSSAFILPAARSMGLEGQKLMQNLMVRRRFPVAMAISSSLTILAGILLYWRDSGGLQLSWITSPVGLGFTIGALAALASYFYGALVMGPTARRFGELHAAIHAEATAKQQAELSRLDARMSTGGRINIVLMIIALLGMATARYWWF